MAATTGSSLEAAWKYFILPLQEVPDPFEPPYGIEGCEQRLLIRDRKLDMRCNHIGEPARIADPFKRRLDLRHTRITLLYCIPK